MTMAAIASLVASPRATPTSMPRPSLAIVLSVLLHAAGSVPLALMSAPAVHIRPMDSVTIEVALVIENVRESEPEGVTSSEPAVSEPEPPPALPLPPLPEPAAELPAPLRPAAPSVPPPPPSPEAAQKQPQIDSAPPPPEPMGPSPTKARATVAEEAAYVPPRGDISYLRNFPPFYPASARRRGIEGTVTLRIQVGTDGRPAGVRIHESSGFTPLDLAAVEAVWLWRFEPARRNGRPVTAEVEVPIRFRLSAAARP